MTTPANIIKGHRQTLINRLVVKNQLLRFKPSDRGFKSMDVCDLFAEDTLLANASKSAGDFFKELIRGWAGQQTTEVKLPEISVELTRRLTRMKKDADNASSASGMHALFWAWPFAHVPYPGHKPLAAPLLFWPIDIKQSKGVLRVRMLEGAPHHNFILAAWLKHYRNLSLDFRRLVGDEADEWDGDEWDDNALAGRISQFAESWAGCRNDVDANNLHRLRKFPADNEQLAILPCAAVGVAQFKYWALLNDLDKLIPKAEDGGNLLHEFFQATAETRQPAKATPPGEAEKYLVEQSDAAQEWAVWQTRKSKVMLLKGPPGTGKSQTIVNLIADALKKEKRTALICDQRTALDVVKKRLDDKGLGNLAVTIVDPSKQRRDIIQSVKTVKDGDGATVILGDSGDRSSHASQISKLERECGRATESRGCDKRGHSMRGDFLGRMAKAREHADFDPFDSSHGQFAENVCSHLPKNEGDLDATKDNLRNFADDYEECRYTDNRWSDCRCRPDEGANIMMRFNALVGRAEALDGRRDHLPAESLVPLLLGGMMKKYAQSLFSGAKKEAVALLADLIHYTKGIFAEAKLASEPPIWENIFQGRGSETYRRYAEDAAHLEMVASINERLQSDKLTAALKRHYGEAMRRWPTILDAMFCYVEYRNLPQHSIAQFDRDRKSLKEHIDRKRGADAAAVLRAFPHRQGAAKDLYDKGLLRMKKSRNGSASTIRRICHADLKKFSKVFPAMLLNPDTMSKILPLEPGILDLAIVDEASQMFVADALPILYRAKSIVISGDNMQMPPEDTFAIKNDGEDDAEEEEDESPPLTKVAYTEEPALLDAAAGWIPADSVARCELNVHYRSRPPELIAFSNHAFYSGKLQASPDNVEIQPPLTRPIEVIPVEGGVFQNKANEAEAQAIVELLKRVLKPVQHTDNPPLSVGVIVFNGNQAKRLNEMIDNECDPDFKRAVNQLEICEDGGLFVRSVQHMQGDERDIIILGTTYGPNTANFGSLSRSEKGRRRLNVAVTRAKHGMYVVSSLDIDHISHGGERPGGDNKGSERWYLWKFMQYARAVSDGNRDAAVAVLRSLNSQYAPHQTGRKPDSQFEIDVAEFLRAKSYEVDYQIGESGFRIDLGVKRKSDSRYLCGIECDGRFWHEGWQARQNDIWRQGILEDKGWNIYRIWSDAWYSTSGKAQKALLAHLKKLADDAD